MKATIKDIVPGRVLYYVSCCDAQRAKDARLAAKVIVTSGIHSCNIIGRPMFSCTDDHRPYGYDWERKGTYHYLGDVGLETGRTPSNLHRLFTSEKSALAYVEECHSGKFSSLTDQTRFNDDLKLGLYHYDD